MQWSTLFSMPTAIGIPKGEEQRRFAVENFRTLFHWWSPDAAFTHLDASMLVFPQHNRREWEAGWYRTAYPEKLGCPAVLVVPFWCFLGSCAKATSCYYYYHPPDEVGSISTLIEVDYGLPGYRGTRSSSSWPGS